MAINTYGYPVIKGANQTYYDRLHERLTDAAGAIARAKARPDGGSDGTGGGIWPGLAGMGEEQQSPPPTTAPPPDTQGPGPDDKYNPPPIMQPPTHYEPDNTQGGPRPTYRGPAQSTDDLFAKLMDNVQNRPAGAPGGAPPPPPPPTEAPPPVDTGPPVPPPSDGTIPGGTDDLPGDATDKGTETPNRPHSMPVNPTMPFDISALPPVVGTSIASMWAQWDQADTLGFLNMLANSQQAGPQAQQWAAMQLEGAQRQAQ